MRTGGGGWTGRRELSWGWSIPIPQGHLEGQASIQESDAWQPLTGKHNKYLKEKNIQYGAACQFNMVSALACRHLILLEHCLADEAATPWILPNVSWKAPAQSPTRKLRRQEAGANQASLSSTKRDIQKAVTVSRTGMGILEAQEGGQKKHGSLNPLDSEAETWGGAGEKCKNVKEGMAISQLGSCKQGRLSISESLGRKTSWARLAQGETPLHGQGQNFALTVDILRAGIKDSNCL